MIGEECRSSLEDRGLCRFWRESILNLHQSLAKLSSGLILKVGHSQDLVTELLRLVKDNLQTLELHYHVDYGCGAEKEAETLEDTLSQAATNAGQRLCPGIQPLEL